MKSISLLIEQAEEAAKTLQAVTLEECDTLCRSRARYRCCSEEYCHMAKSIAKEVGFTLPEETGNEVLPFMGEHGCVLPLWVRPLCTAHACALNTYGGYMPEGWFDRHAQAASAFDKAMAALFSATEE